MNGRFQAPDANPLAARYSQRFRLNVQYIPTGIATIALDAEIFAGVKAQFVDPAFHRFAAEQRLIAPAIIIGADRSEMLAPLTIETVEIDAQGVVTHIDVKSAAPRSHWVWGAFTITGRVFAELYGLWLTPGRRDEYFGTLVNAWLARGGSASAVPAGETYLDVGTLSGYRAAVQGKNLQLQMGYSHDVSYPIPEGITIKCEKPTSVLISGFDKQKVGQVAAEIRAVRPPEPYKGKGIKYDTETILRKEGKKK